MANEIITEAFRSYGATLKNHMWAYSAIADDGSVVVSLWSDLLKLNAGVLTYTDKFSRWKSNKLGNALFAEHLALAYRDELPLRLVVATAKDWRLVDLDDDATKIEKEIHAKRNVVGKVTTFDGDNVVITFQRIAA
jgi:hypothetical protein